MSKGKATELAENKERVNDVLRTAHEIVARHKHNHNQIRFDGEAPPDGGEFKRVLDAWESGTASQGWFSIADITREQKVLIEKRFMPAEGTLSGRWDKYWKDALAAVLDMAHKNYEASHK